jgi:hypothetical protein
MSYFLLSAIVTFGIVQFVLRSQVLHDKLFAQWTVGGILLAVVDWRLIVIFTSLCAAAFAAVWFGALAGWVFAGIYNRLARTDTGDLTGRDRVEFIVLLLFVLLGVFGESTVTKFASRITAFKFGGAEIALAAGDSRASAQGQPGLAASYSSSQPSDFAPGEPSTGLNLLMFLGDLVDRDQAYLRMLSPATSVADAGKFEGSRDFAHHLVQPVALCLVAYAKHTGDTALVNDVLAKLLDPARKFMVLEPKDNYDTWIGSTAAIMLDQQIVVARLVWGPMQRPEPRSPKDPEPKFNTDQECKRMIAALCGVGAESTKACKTLTSEAAGPGAAAARYRLAALKTIEGQLRRAIEARRALTVSEERPYFVLLYASLMAQLGKHPAAMLALDRWIGERNDLRSVDAQWLKVRALNALTVLADEWIRVQQGSVPLAVRDYYLRHLEEMDTLLAGFGAVPPEQGSYLSVLLKAADNGAGLEGATFRTLPGSVAACANLQRQGESDAHRQERQLRERRFLQLYLTNRLGIAAQMVEHPEYGSKYISKSAALLAAVYRTDFRCAFEEDTDLQVAQTQMLYVIANGLLKEARVLAPIRKQPDTESRLQRALDAVRLALETIDSQQSKDRKAKDRDAQSGDKLKSNIAMFGSTLAIDTYSALLRLRADLNKALADL